MADQKLTIQIETVASGNGVAQAAAGVQQVANAAQKAAPAMQQAAQGSKEFGQGLGKAVEVGGATTALMQNLAQASQGGASGMFAIGRAILSFGQIVKNVLLGAGPVGLAVASVGLLVGAVIALKEAFGKGGESIDEFKTRLAEADKTSLKALDATLVALTERLTKAKTEADAVRASLDKIDDAEMAAKLAAVNNSKLTPEQKAEQELLVRDEFKQRRQTRERQALEENVSATNQKMRALAPEFKDARDKFSDLDNERDRMESEKRELARLKADRETRLGEQGWMLTPEENQRRTDREARIAELERSQLSPEDRAKFDIELASARDRFQGADGKGGMAAQYNASVDDADKAARALERFNYTLEQTAKWEKAQIRIENGGVDPRDKETAARQSPGRARMVGPGGQVKEYDVQSAPTINQQIAAQAEAARVDPVAPAGNQLRRGGGALLGDGSGTLPKGITEVKKAADSMKESLGAAAEQKLPDFKPAADASEAIAKNLEEFSTVANQQIAAIVDTMTTASGAVTANTAAIAAIKAELRTLKSQFATSRAKSN